MERCGGRSSLVLAKGVLPIAHDSSATAVKKLILINSPLNEV